MAWLLRRIGISALLLWGVITILFTAIHLVPGNPAEVLLSYGGAAPDPAAVAALRARLGLDRPLIAQYAGTLAGLVQGDFGRSLQDGASVAAQIGTRLPRTLELIGAAALLSIAVGVPAGTLAAVRAGRLFDLVASTLAGVMLAIPIFVVGTLLVLIFAQSLRWLPAGGFVPFAQAPGQHLTLLVMPAVTIAVGLSAILFRMTRASVLETMARDHVRAAHAKGVGPVAVLVRHVLRNALAPIVTVLALNLGTLLGGTVLVEYVFNWPGLSGFLVSAVSARDYPAVVGVVLVISTLFIALNLAVDILFVVLDPRVR